MERRDAGIAVGGPVLARQAAEGALALHEGGEVRPLVSHRHLHVEVAKRRSDPVDLRLDEDQLQPREAVEHTAYDHLPERPAREERVLVGQREDRGHARWRVAGHAGTAVLTDRQPHFLDGSPDGIERGIEEERAARVERRHHDAAEALLLGPVDVLHCLLDVVEDDRGLSRDPPLGVATHLGEPAVVDHLAGPRQLGARRLPRVVERARLEGHTVGEHHLGDDALALEIAPATVEVPLGVDAELRVEVARVGPAARFRRSQPVVEGVEVLLFCVVAIRHARRLDVSVDGDDCGLCHRDVLQERSSGSCSTLV
jgi:hypothetical protein